VFTYDLDQSVLEKNIALSQILYSSLAENVRQSFPMLLLYAVINELQDLPLTPRAVAWANRVITLDYRRSFYTAVVQSTDQGGRPRHSHKCRQVHNSDNDWPMRRVLTCLQSGVDSKQQRQTMRSVIYALLYDQPTVTTERNQTRRRTTSYGSHRTSVDNDRSVQDEKLANQDYWQYFS